MKKQLVALILTFVMVLSLTACGNQPSASTAPNDSGAQTQPQSTEDNWPTADIPMIIPYGAGGGADLSSRAIAEYWGRNLGVDFTIENRGGANGQTGTTHFLNQYNDTDPAVCFIAETQFTCSQILQSATYSLDDFSVISVIEKDPAVIGVNPDSPYKTFDDLNAAIKANPGQFKVGTQPTSAYYLLLLQTIKTFNWDVKILFYEGNENVTALAGGHIDIGVYGASSIVTNPYARCLVIGSPERWEHMPDVPTISELSGEQMPFLGIMRMFAVRRDWAEKNPTRFQKLCDTYKAVFDMQDYKDTAKLSGKDTVQQYMNPEDSQKAWLDMHNFALTYSEDLANAGK